VCRVTRPCCASTISSGQVVVRTHDVADDVALGGDDVQCRNREGAAVADDEVGTGGPGHRKPVVFGPLLRDEVQHDIGAGTLGEVPDCLDVPAVGDNGVLGAEFLSKRARLDGDLRR
jgi:hypothetical protein